MDFKEKAKSLKKKFFKSRASSPAPSTTQSTDALSSYHRNAENGSKTSSIVATQPCIPLPLSTTDAQATRPSTEAMAVEPYQLAAGSQALPLTPLVTPCSPKPTATEYTEQHTSMPSVSQRLWNAAYDSLETDDDLIRSYLRTLEEVLGGETCESTDDLSAKLKDPADRQKHMMELVQKGQEKIFKASRITTGVGEVAGFILSVKEVVDLVLRGIPQAAPAALPWAGVCLGLQMLQNPAQATKSNLAGIARVISRMDWYCALTEHLLNKNNISTGNDFQAVLHQLEERVVELYKALLLYQMKSVCSYYRNQGLVFLRGMIKLDDWDGDLKLVTDAEAAVQNDAAQYFQEQTKISLTKLVKHAEGMEVRLGNIHQTLQDFISLQKDIRKDDAEAACRRDLRVVDPQHDMERIERSKDELLDDAYKWILRTPEYIAFTNWDDNGPDGSSRRLLWIKGQAGTGKTMLMIGIIRQLFYQPVTIAPALSFFFCQGTDTALNNATAVLRSLLWLLFLQQPCLISHLLQKYKESGANLFNDKNAFYALSEVFKNMLKDSRLSPVYLAVDALDECAEGRSDLIHLISTSLVLSRKVKWLLSGRPEVDVLAELKDQSINLSDASETFVELDTQRLEEPVNAYISHKLTTIKRKKGYSDNILAKVSDEICQRAGNTFLWVALAFKDLDEVCGWDAIERIREMPSGLLQLYDHMMARIEKLKRIKPQDCKKVLEVTFLAFRPLCLDELAAITSLQLDHTKETVKECGSFVTVTGETVNLIHQSAKDYLDKNYIIRIQSAGVAQGHIDIGRRSIDAMSSILKQNMYNLDFGFKPNDMMPPNPDPLAPIRYSCVFGLDHFCFLGDEYPECARELTDNGKIFEFLRDHFLHWLESLSLLGNLSDGAQSVRKLLHITQPGLDSRLIEFLKDAKKFFLSNGSIMERSPLQIDGSALVFSPTLSDFRNQQWKERLSFIEMTAGIKDRWGVPQQTLEGHRDYVWAVAFSPDGKMLASGSADHTVRLWDTATGALQKTLEGHTCVRTVAFSPDGKTLASLSRDQTVQIWDAATGTLQKTLEGHIGSVNEVIKAAFSPDGKTLALVLGNRTIQIWDATTSILQQTLEGHSDQVNVLAFSPDGKTLASASEDEPVRLWDTATGTLQQTLGQRGDYINVLAVSPDGRTLASASNDCTVRLWDAAARTLQQTLEGHSDFVSAIAFSPDGKTLASASEDKTVRLWDAATGTLQQTLEGHSDFVDVLAFSPGGKTLASASGDKTVRLWDVAAGTLQQTLEGHHIVDAMAFSSDDKMLALAVDDRTVRLLDTATGMLQQTLETHSTIKHLSFSRNGQYLETDQGLLGIASKVDALSTSTDQETARGILFIDDDWVTRDGEKLLWLPYDYRPSCEAVYGHTIALGHNSGNITFLYFAFNQ